MTQRTKVGHLWSPFDPRPDAYEVPDYFGLQKLIHDPPLHEIALDRVCKQLGIGAGNHFKTEIA